MQGNRMSNKSGYTLVEMAVVMAIASILMVLGVGALRAVRNDSILDARIEEAISTVREAQNRAISFSKWEQDPTLNVNVWGSTFQGAGINLTAVVNSGTANNQVRPSAGPSGFVATNNGGGSLIVVYFVPPFGKSYIFNNHCNIWTVSNLPTKEYVPASSCVQLASARITYTYGGLSRSFNINGQGEIKVE
jgi:prepilin-type N-terminal cleavage/methylation domain-containing protein